MWTGLLEGFKRGEDGWILVTWVEKGAEGWSKAEKVQRD